MGEFAFLNNSSRIKIGTCENMYYCRHDQINQIQYDGMCHGLNWRIPAFEEDGIKPGSFEFGALVEKWGPLRSVRLKNIDNDFDGLESDGIVQLKDERSGMLVNVKCYHGLRLPEGNDDFKAFFNGKCDTLYLQALKNTPDDLRIVFACSACRSAWNCSFDEIYTHIADVRMLFRLYKQVNQYSEVAGEPWKYAIVRYELEKRSVQQLSKYDYKERILKYILHAHTEIENGQRVHVVGCELFDEYGEHALNIEHKSTDFASALLAMAEDAGIGDELLFESPRAEAYKERK